MEKTCWVVENDEICGKGGELSRGMCYMHYRRFRLYGTPTPSGFVPRPRGTLAERLWAKVDKDGPNGCWLWTGSKSQLGYGTIWHGETGGNIPVHRASYELLVGPVAPELDMDHLCRNPPCVNPDHLEPVTHRENVLRGVGPTAQEAAKTHCIRGHEFSADNTRIDKNGIRHCRTCVREDMAAERETKRQAKGQVRRPHPTTQCECGMVLGKGGAAQSHTKATGHRLVS